MLLFSSTIVHKTKGKTKDYPKCPILGRMLCIGIKCTAETPQNDDRFCQFFEIRVWAVIGKNMICFFGSRFFNFPFFVVLMDTLIVNNGSMSSFTQKTSRNTSIWSSFHLIFGIWFSFSFQVCSSFPSDFSEWIFAFHFSFDLHQLSFSFKFYKINSQLDKLGLLFIFISGWFSLSSDFWN